MVADKIIWLTDRSRTLQDWKCPRARYWGYHHEGRGVVPPDQGLELMLGSALHDGLAAIATNWKEHKTAPIDMIALACGKSVYESLMTASGGDEDGFQFAKEQSVLIEGMLRGFYAYAWPSLIAQYPKVIAVEQEMTYPLMGGLDKEIIDPRGEIGWQSGSMVFMSKPDLILATEDDETWVYVEYKSTSSKSENWVNQWNTSVQIHSTIKAVEHTLGKAPAIVVVQGLYKGYQSYGKQSSPFCYAYYRQGTPPFSYPEYSYTFKPGFKRVPVWELAGENGSASGLAGWINGMPEQVLAEQFPQTPPLYIKPELVERFFAQRTLREVEIKQALGMTADPDLPLPVRQQFMDAFFPQKFDQCNPAGFGRPCQFRFLCHGGIEDPLASGWTKRQPHHELEMEQVNNENSSDV